MIPSLVSRRPMSSLEYWFRFLVCDRLSLSPMKLLLNPRNGLTRSRSVRLVIRYRVSTQAAKPVGAYQQFSDASHTRCFPTASCRSRASHAGHYRSGIVETIPDRDVEPSLSTLDPRCLSNSLPPRSNQNPGQ